VADLHPLLAQMSPSEEQMPSILKRGTDVAVTAGAGTGKTRTLVARYLSLLLDDVPLRSVVAITFTKKAAREMRNRVRQEVRRYLDAGQMTDEERTRWQQLYETLDAARIGTIHSLCGELLRNHPAEAAIDPRFETLDEGQAALLLAQAVEAALAWAADDPQAARLFADFGEWELPRLLTQLLKQRLDIAALPRPDDWWAVWEPHLVAPLRAFVEDAAVQTDFADLLTLRADGTLSRAEAAGDNLAAPLAELLRLWDVITAARTTDDWATVSAHLAPLRGAMKQVGRQANWAPANPKAIIKELQIRYDETLKPLVGDGVDLALDQTLASAILPELLRLYDYALAAYTRLKEDRRALDFDDLEAGALALLRDHPAARARWQAEVRALLVDEFQDTNARQRDLLALLNGDAGKLFIVGDGKQSIYRFRGADVTVFRAARREIADQGKAFTLDTSFRAHGNLVAALNALLQPVLGVDEDPARPYVEPFAALTHFRESPLAGLTSPYVELHLGVGSKTGGALDKAAEALVIRLAALVENGHVQLTARDPDTGQSHTRPLDYGDIAILCRASTSFAPYENALERAGIPFLTVAGRGFYERPEVRDVLNALTVLADPTDDLALAGLLRSPACGLSDLALYRLTEECTTQKAPSLWTVLNGAALDFLVDEAPCAAEAVALIQRLHAQAGRVMVAALLKAFLDATHYCAALLRAGQARGAGNLAKLLADAHTSGIVSVGEFLDYVTQLRDAGTREGEAHTLSVGAVQLMTVHAAKGLEFPVIVIGDAGKAARGGRGAVVDSILGVVPPLKSTGDDDAPSATSLAYRLAQQAAADQEEAESDRLLYVAATRAQDMLILSGTVSARKDGLGLDGWLERLDTALHLSTSAPACDPEGEAIRQVTLSAGAQPVNCTLYEGNTEIAPPGVSTALPAQAAWPETLPLLDPLIPPPSTTDDDTEAEHRDPPRRVWRVVPEKARPSAPAWVVGTLVHGALEQWLFPDGVRFARWAEAEARGRGITDAAELRNAVQRAARMLTRFQATDLYTAMNAATQRLHEVPYTLATPGGALERGTLDALFRTDGQWTLVEFKTDHVTDQAALTALLDSTDYRAQVTRYLDAAERLLGTRPRPALCFLNVGGAVRVVTDL